MFDWGDGTSSSWSTSPSASHAYWTLPRATTFVVVHARCADNAAVVSSAYVYAVVQISPRPPEPPSGPTSVAAGDEVTFCTGGALFSKANFPLEYLLDWGDETPSDWSSSTCQSHRYSNEGEYQIRAQARLASDPGCMLCITSTERSAETILTVTSAPRPAELHISPFVLMAEAGFKLTSSSTYTTSGRITLRGESDDPTDAWVEFSAESLTVDTLKGQLSGDGKLVLNGVPGFGAVTIWEGPLKLSLLESTSVNPKENRRKMKLAGLDVDISKLQIQTTEGRITGLVIEEFSVGVHKLLKKKDGPGGVLTLKNLELTKGGVSFTGGAFRVENIDVANGLCTLNYVELSYDATEDRLGGGCEFEIPEPFGGEDTTLTVGGHLTFEHGALVELAANFEAADLNEPVCAMPPIFLDRLAGGFTITPEDITLSLGFSATLFPKITDFSLLESKKSDMLKLGSLYVLKLDVDAARAMRSGAFEASAAVTVVSEGFQIASAHVKYDPKGDDILDIDAEMGESFNLGGIVLGRGHLYVHKDGTVDGRFEAGKLAGVCTLADVTLQIDANGVTGDATCPGQPVFLFEMTVGELNGAFTLAKAHACMWKDGRISAAGDAGRLFDSISLAAMSLEFDPKGLAHPCVPGAVLCWDGSAYLLAGTAEGKLYIKSDGTFNGTWSMRAFAPPDNAEWQWFWGMLDCVGKKPQSFDVAEVELDERGVRFSVNAGVGQVAFAFDATQKKWNVSGQGPDFNALVAAAQQAAADPGKTLGNLYDGAVKGLTCMQGRVYEALPPQAKGGVDFVAGGIGALTGGAGYVAGLLRGCDILLVDSAGHLLGIRSGTTYAEIPGAYFFYRGEEKLFLLPADLDFQADVFGTATNTAQFSYAVPAETGSYTAASYAVPLTQTASARLAHGRGRAAEPVTVDTSGTGTYDTVLQPAAIVTSPRTAAADSSVVFDLQGSTGVRRVTFFSKKQTLVSDFSVISTSELPASVQTPGYPVVAVFSIAARLDPGPVGSVEVRFGIPDSTAASANLCAVALLRFDEASKSWQTCGTSLVGTESGFLLYAARPNALGLMAACYGVVDHPDAGVPEGIVCFRDPALEQRVREVLKLSAGDITAADLAKLEALSFSPGSQADLTGLEHAVHLQELDIAGAVLTDLSPIARLKELKKLCLSSCRVGSFDALAGLEQLEMLRLSAMQMTDLSPLSTLANLNELVITGTKLTNLSKLTGLNRLRTLVLTDDQVTDISALGKLRQLETLNLEKNRIRDISSLKGLVRLRKLDLSDNQISETWTLAYNSLQGGFGQGDQVDVMRNPLNLTLFSRNAGWIRDVERTGCDVWCDGLPWLTPGGFWALVGGSAALILAGVAWLVRRRHRKRQAAPPTPQA
jgi:hypothetical protein